MNTKEIAEVAELVDIIRKLPPKLRAEIYFMIKGAALVANYNE